MPRVVQTVFIIELTLLQKYRKICHKNNWKYVITVISWDLKHLVILIWFHRQILLSTIILAMLLLYIYNTSYLKSSWWLRISSTLNSNCVCWRTNKLSSGANRWLADCFPWSIALNDSISPNWCGGKILPNRQPDFN